MAIRGLKQTLGVAVTATGFNVTAINSAVVAGTTISCEGHNQISLYVTYTRSAGTGIQFNIEVSDDGSTFYKLQTAALSSGTLTLSDVLYTKVSSATVSFVVNFEINATHFRLANVVATGSPNSNDKATVSAIIGGF
jgi:hypothetical protein|tara:strand:- start:548 stop:958 length:411 start_codon:yes stop_codon:yes gene_type:complete